MKKKLFVLILCCLVFGAAKAQISQGDTYSSNIKTGNRPESGDWGVYIGPSYSEFRDFIDWCDKNKDVDIVRGLPLINLKFFSSDNLEWRAGLQYYSKTTSYSGEIAEVGKETNKISQTLFRFTPGIAYHFSSKNILDVYVGGVIPLGVDVDKNIYTIDDIVNNAKRNSFVIGLGAYVGLQAFVADLPFSIGIECGIQGLLKCGQKVKHTVTDSEGNNQTYYTPLNEEYQYSKLNSSVATFGSDVRLTFTYYFNNKK